MNPYDYVNSQFTLPFRGYKFQEDAINYLATLQNQGHYLEMGCVDGETEYLTQTGWKKFKNGWRGEKVMQWSLDGTKFAAPSRFTDEPCEEMNFFHDTVLDMALSDGHRVLYSSQVYRPENGLKVEPASSVAHDIEQGLFTGRVPIFHGNKLTWQPARDAKVTRGRPVGGRMYCFTVPSSYLVLRRGGCIFVTGNCGKTYTATMSALYQLVKNDAQHAIVLMPPILIDGWLRFLNSIPEIKTLAYRGTPAQRRDLALGHHEFTLMSYQIFKGDFEHIESKFRNRRVIVIPDEATAIKNIASANHKKFVNFTQGRSRALLTGSPLSNPMDAYAYCKLVAPGVYRNMNQFKNIHVAEVDFFGTVTKWRELDLLAQNMKVNSVRITVEEALKDLPEVTYNVMPYRLAPAHMRLYRQLADEQLLLMQDGGKIDATSSTRLYNALQQIILNWDHFGQDSNLVPGGLTLLDEVLAQCQGEKLVVCANYRMSNRMLLRYLKRYNAVAIYGENSSTQNRKSVDDFIDKDEIKVCIIQPTSGGYGVDGLQEVCRDMLFLEAPTVPRDFHQTVARLRRNGQRFNTNVRIAVAQGTIQMRLHENLLRNDELVNRVVPSAADLREAIYGG